MPKAIKNIHDRINLAIRKGQTGYFSTSEIDAEIYAEINDMWRKYVVEFEKTRIINIYLNPFIKTEDVTPNPSDGSVTLTNAFHYPLAIRVKANGKEVNELDQARWDVRINHPIEFPTADYPICKFENKKLWARPINIGELTVSYINKPVAPVYAYTIVNNRPVYNDGASVDVEFDVILHNDLVSRVLRNLGVPMREELLIRDGQQNKMEEGT